ncbi:MAG: hypothetical protein Q7T73_11500 [Beijerinckiaceae bacterium]|nr:hypothetical protein [Beijerinckiaceae bacterium]
MATQPKAQDPTAAALSAIEEALNLTQAPEPVGPPPAEEAERPAAQADRSNQPVDRAVAKLPEISERELMPRQRQAQETRAQETRAEVRAQETRTNEARAESQADARAVAPSSPANDDRRSVGQILQTLQVRPSATPLVVAGLGSVIWLGLVGLYATGLSSPTPQDLVMLAIAGLGPVVFFFVTATLMRRAQEMRLTARAMTEVAMRLAEPEAMATEQVVTLSQAIRREVASMGDGIERALARASELETVVRSEVSNLERSYTDNERRIRSLIDELSSEREAIVINADRVRQAISGAHEALSRDLEMASTSIADRVGDAGTRVSSLLGEKGEEISITLSRTGDDLVERISAHGGDIVGRLAETGDDVTAKLTSATELVTNALGGRIDELDQRLKATGESLVADLATRGNEVAARIDETGARIADTISSRGEDLSGRLAATGEKIDQTITVYGGELEEKLGATGDRISASIAERANTIYDLFHTSGHELASQLETHHVQLRDHLEREATDLTSRFANSAEDAINAIATHGDRVTEHLAERLNAFEATVLAQGGRVTETLADRLAIFESSVIENGDRISGELAERLVAFENTIVTHGEVLTGQIATHSDRFTSDVADRLASVESAFTVHGAAFHDRLTQRTDETANLLETRVREFDERAASKAQEIAQSLDGLISKIDNGLDARAKALNETLAHRALEVAQVLGDGGRQVTKALDAKAAEIDEILLNRSTALTETLSAKAQEINETLGGRATEIADTLDNRITTFEERVVGRLDAVSSELDTRGRAVADTLGAKVAEIDDTLAARLGDINSTLERHGADLATSLDSRLEQLTSRLRERGEALHETIASRSVDLQNLFETQGPMLVELLTSRGSEIVNELASVGEVVTHAIENRGSAIVQHLGQKQIELTSAIDQSSVGLRNAIEHSAHNSVDVLLSTKDSLRAEIVGVLDQLAQTSLALQQVVGDAGNNLSMIESSLSDRVQNFDTALNAVSTQVAALSQTAEGTLGSADAIANRLEASNQGLAAVTQQVARTQVDLDAALEARRQSLETILAAVGTRTEDFDNVMRSFSSLIDESFRRAEVRAREIGSFLSDSTQSVVGMIDQQFEEVRATSGKERERTSAALRAAYEQANTEMNQIFSSAIDRFKASAAEMRGVSGEIQRELENTRQELRRGAVELPRETAEQASAMRRVVAEQIKALNELTDIVARSGRAYDVAEPTPVARRSEPVRIAERAVETPRAETFRQPEPVRMAEPYRAETFRKEEPVAVRRPTQPAPRPAAPAAPTPERGTGWLSDLLARASRDEQDGARAGATRPRAEPLDQISLDIARMIDHDAAVDLWDRYNRGERNAFSRRLYTAQGQQTFDEIRRRYRADSEFRDTVDRYTSEFERLLGEVNRDDRDGMLTKTYLTSETGKVYTMLAHAAGRFD